jgi:hypothetical protein
MSFTKGEVVKIIQDCRNEFNLIIEEVIGFEEDNTRKWDNVKEFDEIIRRLNLLINTKLEEYE